MTEDWWATLYDEVVAEMYLDRTPGELDATVSFLERQAGLRVGDRVFDQCCGVGALSLEFARRGYEAVGVDLCEEYIERAGREGQRLGVAASFHCGDAFEFVASPPCRAAFNWYTSFGYSEDDARNRRMLEKAFDSLEDGGAFALDYPNVAHLLRHFQTCIVRRHPTDPETMLIRESRLDLERGQLVQTWTVVTGDGHRRESESRVRLYLPCELAAMVEQVGFVDVRLFGGVGEEPLTLDSVRCVLVARKGDR